MNNHAPAFFTGHMPAPSPAVGPHAATSKATSTSDRAPRLRRSHRHHQIGCDDLQVIIGTRQVEWNASHHAAVGDLRFCQTR